MASKWILRIWWKGSSTETITESEEHSLRRTVVVLHYLLIWKEKHHSGPDLLFHYISKYYLQVPFIEKNLRQAHLSSASFSCAVIQDRSRPWLITEYGVCIRGPDSPTSISLTHVGSHPSPPTPPPRKFYWTVHTWHNKGKSASAMLKGDK